jgi:NhaA family Na+:H+ antiporter
VAGIGFTVSLFIADLAYADAALTETAKVGIFAGSLVAGAIGAALMIAAGRRLGAVVGSTDASVPDRRPGLARP